MTDYPNEPGFYSHAPETSRLAAKAIAPIASSHRALVLAAVTASGANGLTGFEVAARTDLSVYQVRSRLSELVADSKIMDSERRRAGEAGRSCAVWVTPEHGPPPPEPAQVDWLDAA